MKKFYFFILLYIIIIAFYSYPYGQGGHVEELSYAKYLFNDGILYFNDFYIQNTASHIPNERYFFAQFINLFTGHSDIIIFFLHFLVSIVTFLGVFSIARKYLKYENSLYLFVFTLFIPLSRFSFGGNYLYNNELVSGSIASMLAVWALLYFINEKYYHFVLFVTLSTFFHAIVGVQTFVLCLFAFGFHITVFQKEKSGIIKKQVLAAIVIYLAIIAPILFLLFQSFYKNKIDDALFYEIIAFRLPHHFIPSMFRGYHYGIVIPLLLFSIYYFYKKDSFLLSFFIVFLLFLFPYVVATDFFRSPIFFFTQWTRASILLIPLALIAVFSALENCEFYKNIINKVEKVLIFGFFLLCSISVFSIIQYNSSLFLQNYNLPFKKYRLYEDVNIALLAKENILDKKALFVQPASICTLKYFGEKSSFVDMLAFPHGKKKYALWYERIKKIYQFDLSKRDYSKSIFQQADDNFYKLKESDFQKLHDEDGVTHILTKHTHILSFNKVIKNEEYVIYEIK